MIVNYSDSDVIKTRKSIFLAGPTPRKKEIVSWRKEAIKIFEENNFDGIVYIPENSDDTLFKDQLKQMQWEREALTNATIIMFWIPRSLPDMPAFTTNVEFGYWLHTKKCIYGRPDDSTKKKYLDWLYELDYGVKPINTLETLIKEAIKQCNERE